MRGTRRGGALPRVERPASPLKKVVDVTASRDTCQVEGRRHRKPSRKILEQLEFRQLAARGGRHNTTSSAPPVATSASTEVPEPKGNGRRSGNSHGRRKDNKTETKDDPLYKSVQEYTNAIASGEAAQPSSRLQQIQQMLASQWRSRLKASTAAATTRSVPVVVKPVIRESVLLGSGQPESSHNSEDEEEFHGFSESEVESARSRASSLYSGESKGPGTKAITSSLGSIKFKPTKVANRPSRGPRRERHCVAVHTATSSDVSSVSSVQTPSGSQILLSSAQSDSKVISKRKLHQLQEEHPEQGKKNQPHYPKHVGGRRSIKTPSRFADYDTETVMLASPSKSLLTSTDSDDRSDIVLAMKKKTNSCDSVAVFSSLSERHRRSVKPPRKLEDFQMQEAKFARCPATRALIALADDISNSDSAARLDETKKIPVPESMIASPVKKKRGRKPKVTKGAVDTDKEEDFRGFTDAEIERALSVRSGSLSRNSVMSTLSASRVRREPKTPRRLAEFHVGGGRATITNHVQPSVSTETTSDAAPVEGESSVGEQKSSLSKEGEAVKLKNKRSRRPKAEIILTKTTSAEAAAAHVAVKSKLEGNKALAAPSEAMSDKENLASQVEATRQQQRIVTCQMLTIVRHGVGVVVEPLQARRKPGRPPGKKSIADQVVTAAVGLPTLLPAAMVASAARDSSSASDSTIRPRRGRPPKRFLAALAEDGDPQKRTRWRVGECVCQVCGRDCGYRQNLLIHLKRHVRRGEADASCLSRPRRGRRSARSTGTVDDATAGVAVRAEGPVLVARKNASGAARGLDEYEEIDEQQLMEIDETVKMLPARQSGWIFGLYICDTCGKDCGYMTNLNLHRKRTHGISEPQECLGPGGDIPNKRVKTNSLYETIILSRNRPTTGSTGKKLKACKKCTGCLAEECQLCRFCLDKPKYGGENRFNKRCVKRRCLQPVVKDETKKVKRVNGNSNKDKVYGGTVVHLSQTGERSLLTKAMACRQCVNCKREDCGICKSCLDKPKFGGPGSRKTRCRKRTCLRPKSLGTPSTTPLSYVRKKTNTSIQKEPECGDSSDSEESRFSSSPEPPEIQESLEDFVGRGMEESSPVKKFPVSEDYAAAEKLVEIPVSSACLSPSKCSVAVDYAQEFDAESNSLFGQAVVSSCASVPELCFLCGSAGLEGSMMLRCLACCEPAHPFCLSQEEMPRKEEASWVCSRCVRCRVCGFGLEASTPGEPLLERRVCGECGDMFHLSCLPNNSGSSKKEKEAAAADWTCRSCLKCSSCGTAAVKEHDQGEILCSGCCNARARGSFCPLCRVAYDDDDYEQAMMECSSCGGWIHARCEGLDGEEYQVLSILPDTVEYQCRCKEPAPSSRRRRSQSQTLSSKSVDIQPPTPGLIDTASSNQPSSADSPLRFSALKTLTPEPRVSEFADQEGVVIARPPPPQLILYSADRLPSPLESPKPSEAEDSTEDDYVMLDAADLVEMPLHQEAQKPDFL